MAELHLWARSVVSVRAGGPVPIQLADAPRDTANQDAGEKAHNLTACQHAPPGHPLHGQVSAEKAAALLIADLEQERSAGLCGGEALGTYGVHHFLARAISMTAVLDLRERYSESRALLEAHRHLVGWWWAAGSLCLELRGPSGVVLDPWCRCKIASVLSTGGDHGGPRGCETVANHFEPGFALHPDLIKRWREPATSQWWDELRPHDGLLRRELGGPTGLYLRRVFRRGPVGRLRDRTYWRPGHVLCPELKALNDTDGRAVEHETWTVWDRENGIYRKEPGRRGPKGVSACWELTETGGRLISVHLRGIQGVRQHETLPHPEGAKPAGEDWSSAGPDSEPYPLPEPGELDGGAVRPSDPTEPPPPEEPGPAKSEPASPEEYPFLALARAKAKELHGMLNRHGEKKLALEIRKALRQHALKELGLEDEEA